MKIVDVRITPVAIADPPLLNAVGVHEPYALRTILEVETDDGITGLGETYGDAAMLADLERARDTVIGRDPFALGALASALGGQGTGHGAMAMSLAPGTMRERADARLFAALEVPCLDIQGKALGRPVSDLLGGAVRNRVPFAAYLFYKWGAHIDFDDYPPDPFGEVLTPSAMVEQARDLVRRHGFGSLKLKGGVFSPEVEVDTVLALRDAFPDHPIRIDPNTAWTVETSLRVLDSLEGVLEYLEDPTPTLTGMAEVARRTATPLATNMAVIGFDQLPESVQLDACQIILADHHYWGGLQASRELARICDTWGLGLSMHSNSHLGISFAAMVHLGATVPTMVHDYDTHQPWQEDEVVVGGKLPIVDGAVAVPEGPGLGVELDRDALGRLHERYRRCGIRARDDRGQMRRYEPGWTGELPRF